LLRTLIEVYFRRSNKRMVVSISDCGLRIADFRQLLSEDRIQNGKRIAFP